MRKLLTGLFGVAVVSAMPATKVSAWDSTAPDVAPSATPLQRLAHADAPKVVVILLDDAGFAASSTFGGPAASPPLHYSISETFDIGVDTGSAAGHYPAITRPLPGHYPAITRPLPGHYPADAAIGYAFQRGQIERVDVKLR